MPRSRDTRHTRIDRVEVSVYRIPTETPESDGTLEWDSTTMVIVELFATDNTQGLGLTYASESAATLIREKLAGVVENTDYLAINGTWQSMFAAVRNLGRPGVASMAVSAIDVALWDLKAKKLGLPLFRLLG